jgi:hypothetical protein
MCSMARRLVGGWVLTTILACSGMGLCWRQVAAGSHACCAEDRAMTALTKPCASPAAFETAPRILAPPAAAPAVAPRVAVAHDLPAAPALAVRSAKPPPAVLRI